MFAVEPALRASVAVPVSETLPITVTVAAAEKVRFVPVTATLPVKVVEARLVEAIDDQ